MTLHLQNIPEVQVVAEGNSLFSVSLHQELRKSTPGNFVFSALSLSVVAALVKLGARGETADEIANVFNFPHSDETLSNGYSQVLQTLRESTEGYTLCQANKLYCGVGFELKPEYTAAVKKYFDAEIEEVDFSKNFAAAQTINKWVQDFTKNKITELITPDLIDGSTRMVLVNGVYFKGAWENQFDPSSTTKAEFFVDEKWRTEVDMMYKLEELRYVDLDHLDAHAVELPYKGGRLSMIIYLPKQLAGLGTLESGMSDLIPSKILPIMNNSSLIYVSLPRFKIESTLQLKEPLINLGMHSAFTPTADLSGISHDNIYISDVLQKAFIEVNEEGTEAAAATDGGGQATSGPSIVEFQADHPFLFQIVDTSTHFVLFAGCVKNP